MDFSKHRNTAIWFSDGTRTWPYYTGLSHKDLKVKMETELYPGKIVEQIQDIPETRRGGRGNQYSCEGVMDFDNPNIDYITTNFLPEYWVNMKKPKGVSYAEYQRSITSVTE